ncbi:hypothetical protein QQS21_007464 [Conoideocrella luteorostrata]|uniref:Zn(2)-C6 fungal-type domain-containing protein n=1 Tax=Conoideocrella luteorostrata TaxID=1105319 RepID=A0AAJ0FS20_9HYPO|nr:hypothetical protein QQS21_007464 [Conoideocrella luteorostrata]
MNVSSSRPITRKRDRLACTECRRRKLKCDRSLPCDTCLRRDKGPFCAYEAANEPRVQTEAESRLQRLEGIINQLVSGEARSKPAATATSKDHPFLGAGHEDEVFSADETSEPAAATFNGATHWSAISREIDGLRELIAPSDLGIDEGKPVSHDTGLDMLLGESKPSTLSELLAALLPRRREVDSLTSAYFRSRTVCAPFIHSSQFRTLYRDFWANPTATSPLWVSMLFSICHIASNTLRPKTLDGPVSNRFSAAAARCLVIGKYFKPKRFSVESLLLYVQSQCLTCQNMPAAIGTLFGILMRLATGMGYHREPDTVRYSPFEQEMRRRTWSLCMQLDLLTSFHLGLPSCTQFPTWDTQPPRNLRDSDFNEQSLELPPSRPESEHTEILLYIVKHKFTIVFEKILRYSLSATKSNDLDELCALDKELKDVFDDLPEDFRPRAMTDSIVDSPATIVTRLCVSFIYNKAICALHRPYVTKHRPESQLACYEAGMNLVNSFTDAYSQLLPGGQAESERWFMSSITWHDLLLGSTVLCFVLWTDQRHQQFLPDKLIVLQALAKVSSIIVEQADWHVSETGRVHRLLQATIARFSESGTTSNNCIQNWTGYGIEQSESSALYGAGDETPDFANDSAWADLQLLMGISSDFGT